VKKILSKITIVDFVVVMAIILILAAIVVPSFMPPAGQSAKPASAHQAVPARGRR
jgi:type II secretory pathway pseudopilin PulG